MNFFFSFCPQVFISRRLSFVDTEVASELPLRIKLWEGWLSTKERDNSRPSRRSRKIDMQKRKTSIQEMFKTGKDSRIHSYRLYEYYMDL